MGSSDRHAVASSSSSSSPWEEWHSAVVAWDWVAVCRDLPSSAASL